MTYKCDGCGTTHEGLAGVAWEAPDYYFRIAEEQRATRCELDTDTCTIDGEHFFIRGLIELPVFESVEPFVFNCWMSVSSANFERFRNLYDLRVRSSAEPMVGWISVSIPGFDDTLRLVARAHLRDDLTRPYLELEPTDHPLAVAQRNGIMIEDAWRIHKLCFEQRSPARWWNFWRREAEQRVQATAPEAGFHRRRGA